jgi:hypothetical protein
MMERILNKKVLVGAVAVAALVGGGGAVAATQFSGGESEQAILDDAAKRLGVEPSELESALRQALEARVDEAVAAGRLTEEQGAELKQRIEAGEVPVVGGPMFGDHHHGHGFFHGLDAAATYLGLTEEELRTQLESGKTLAEIATADGKTVDGLKQAMLDAAKQDLAQAVEDGKLNEAQQQEILGDLESRLDDIVNGVMPGPGGHHPGEEPPFEGTAPSPDAPSQDAPDDSTTGEPTSGTI